SSSTWRARFAAIAPFSQRTAVSNAFTGSSLAWMCPGGARSRRAPPPRGGPMEYRTLGQTGIQVSTQCLGAMMFGLWGNRDHDECVRIIHAAIDAGINFIDTADVYSAGESEEIVGKALKDRRDDIVLATKVHGDMGSDPNRKGNSRRWIRMEVENSLRRLQTE